MEEMIEETVFEQTIIKRPENEHEKYQVRVTSNQGFVAGFGKTLEEAITDLADSLYKSLLPME